MYGKKNEFEQFVIDSDKQMDLLISTFQSLKRQKQQLEDDYYQKYNQKLN